MDNVKLVNCRLLRTDLCFEFCSNIDAEVISRIESIKNPYSGRIKCCGYNELILDEKYVNKSKIEIVVDEDE